MKKNFLSNICPIKKQHIYRKKVSDLFIIVTVSNKNTHLADFETFVFRGYLWNHLSYKKCFFHLFLSLSEDLSDEKIIFEIR